MCFNTFNGSYEGLLNVDEVLPWEVEYKHVSANDRTILGRGRFAKGLTERLPDYQRRIEAFRLPVLIQEKFQWVNPTKDAKALYQETLRLQTTLL
ncbi:hypothetical protein [Meiothermus cerbereus]|mgnify:CR=1 FL=1|jgi:hypothetical protein|uniref:hypothetical protein n=1 Tax=Meiothermus cerbereus TaxID=65552 RepID=UPI0012EBDD34|nr:hypothetical protein [Meiothermus cerbereus]